MRLYAMTAIVVTVMSPATALAFDALNPFASQSGPSTPEQRAQRQQQRDALRDRFAPGYQMNVPFVSEASVAALEQGVAQYRQIVAAGGWPAVPTGSSVRLGESGAEVIAIRRQLVLSGDLQRDSRRSEFDQEFQDGLARFQIRNGLRVSGFVDSRTVAALNVTADERLAQLEKNLARVRQLMKINKAPRYIIVNVPAYTLQAIERGAVALDSNVVVGKPTRATPEVSASVVEVNFYPTWTVPTSIAKADLIPKLQKDPAYFVNEHFSVLGAGGGEVDPHSIDWSSPQPANFRFVQKPGSNNALGIVRINMPNKHAVYMHDTPLKQLFNQSQRAFSSGCVRVQRVLDVVAWLLAPKGWTPEKVEAAAMNGERIDVKLASPVPVHFVYLTAFVGENGVVQFRPDIYGHDAPQGADDDGSAIVAQQRGAVTP